VAGPESGVIGANCRHARGAFSNARQARMLPPIKKIGGSHSIEYPVPPPDAAFNHKRRDLIKVHTAPESIKIASPKHNPIVFDPATVM
jgi:hypothetical protein